VLVVLHCFNSILLCLALITGYGILKYMDGSSYGETKSDFKLLLFVL
jgi:hypothetical protein